jgi:hypothetical protein
MFPDIHLLNQTSVFIQFRRFDGQILRIALLWRNREE